MREHIQVGGFLFLGHQQRVNVQSLLFAQYLEIITRWDTAQSVKTVFTKDNPMALCHRLPGFPVQWHGVRQGAIAVKYNAVNHVSKFVSSTPCLSGRETKTDYAGA